MKRVLFIVLACIWLAGCGGGKTASGPKPSRPLLIGEIGDMDTTNEFISQSAFTAELAKQFYLPLFKEQPDFQEHPPTFQPELVEKYEFSADGKTLTCSLRKGLLWSDGQPLTARDAVFTHKAATSEGVAWSGADAKQFITSVEAPDDLTLIYKFSRKYPYQLMDVAEGGVLPEHAFGKVPFDQWAKHDFTQDRVFSGPFVLKEWRRQESILLEPNPG